MTVSTPIKHPKKLHKRQNISLEAMQIRDSYNPRWPFPAIQKLGYEPMTLIREWAMGTPEQKAQYCALFEQLDPETVALAESFKRGEEQLGIGQLQAILVRPYRVKIGTSQETDGEEAAANKYETRYGLIAGERRLGANRYLFAKYGLDLPLMAIAIECTKEEAMQLAIEENANRRDPNDIEWGNMYRFYHEKMPRVDEKGEPLLKKNRATGEMEPVVGWTVEAIAEKFNVKAGHVRGRIAVATPGKLTPEQIGHYLGGKIKITRLIEIATGQQPYRNPLEPHHRKGTRTLAEIQHRFDTTPRNATNVLRALAWMMPCYEVGEDGQVTDDGLKQAIVDSDARIQAAEEKASRRNGRQPQRQTA